MKILTAKSLTLLIGLLSVWSCTQKISTMSEKQVSSTAVAAAEWHRADSLLALMTLSEKLGQLQQLDGGISKGELPRLIAEGKVGSVLNEVNPDLIVKYQKIALEESRWVFPC